MGDLTVLLFSMDRCHVCMSWEVLSPGGGTRPGLDRKTEIQPKLTK